MTVHSVNKQTCALKQMQTYLSVSNLQKILFCLQAYTQVSTIGESQTNFLTNFKLQKKHSNSILKLQIQL